MELTDKQFEGLKECVTRYHNGEKYVVISGYAGTGKSTLVKYIIEELNVNPKDVCYATYTGKAAEVLRKKGNEGAITLHKLLYDSVPKPDGGFIRIIKDHLDYKVVVVDEVSMVPRSMLEMLYKHDVFIICLGDPFQLPQIDKNESHTLLNKPHVFLDEIMRQEQESEIIRLTMDIRAGKPISYMSGKEVMVLPKNDLDTSHLLWADQVLCATNNTRIALNNQIRNAYGFYGLPQEGEKLICLKNYWGDISKDGDAALVNGMTGIIKNNYETFVTIPRFLKVPKYKIDVIAANFISEDGKDFGTIRIDKDLMATGQRCIDWKTEYTLSKMKHKIGDIIPKEFDFGYCITVHKSQGSQWEKVLVMEEKFPFDKTEHARWLYTACTRPSEKLVLFK